MGIDRGHLAGVSRRTLLRIMNVVARRGVEVGGRGGGLEADRGRWRVELAERSGSVTGKRQASGAMLGGSESARDDGR